MGAGKSGGGARVVNVASAAVAKVKLENFPPPKASFFCYPVSKAMNILHAKEIQRREGGAGVSAFSAHPEQVMTGIFHARNSLLWSCFRSFVRCTNSRTIQDAAATQLYCALCPDLTEASSSQGGGFFVRCKRKPDKGDLADVDKQKALYDKTLGVLAAFLTFS